MAKHLPVLAVAIALVAGACSSRPTWTYRGEFDDAVAEADRVVVRDAGFDYEGTGNAAVLFEVAAADGVNELRENLQFESGQTRSVCPCTGYPRVDWYRGKRRIATTSIQHGRAIRWKGFQGDAQLTEESRAWLVQWLVDNGVQEEKMGLD